MEKVLIIESIDDRQRLGETLRQAGYEVMETGGTSDRWPGLSYLRDQSFDLVIIDEARVALEGVEVVPALRHLTDAPIIITGAGGEESVVLALLQGGDAYLPHSAGEEAVTAYICALLRRHRTLASAG
jgi:two-component system OmpR family response regulator